MESRSIFLTFFFAAFFLFGPDYNNFSFGFVCKERERQALLFFIADLKYPDDSFSNGILNTWDGKECCNWTGVFCNPKKGNVVELHLQDLSLRGKLNPSLLELKHLYYLNLSANHFNGIQIPSFLGSLHKLRYLDLQRAGFGGIIPQELGNLSNLHFLDISTYQANSIKPLDVSDLQWLSHLSSLQHLHMSYVNLNRVSHKWHHVINMLPSLVELRLASCYLNSSTVPTLSHINFTSLSILDLSNNGMDSSLPSWLYNLTKLEELDLSYNNFYGTISKHIGNLGNLQELDLPENKLRGHISGVSVNSPRYMTSGLKLLDLSSNKLSGPLPEQLGKLQNLEDLYLDHNSFSGSIPLSLGRLSLLRVLELPSNKLNGSLPETIGNLSRLEIFDLSNNALFGEIPESWFNLSSLVLLKLENNNLTGKIPSSIGSLFGLQSLHLGNNSLSGELPLSLRKCTNLIAIDLGENKFSGTISTWLGANFPSLLVLRLRQNKFNGGIPAALCSLTSLQILDIAYNNLSGSIPRCFSNLSAMGLKQKPRDYFSISIPGGGEETFSLVTNGRQYEYSNTLGLVTTMDLSRNNLSGEIPQDLTTLHELRFLNLSGNHFTGKIPDKIGKMSTLESLDFSSNKLSGVIPQSITDLLSLNHLNLSYNNLSGEIPSRNQLQSFTELSYVGNPKLCGFPLENCNEDEHPPSPEYGREKQDDEEDDWLEMKWFYISAGVGFVTGFWGLCGVLLWKQSWRHAYFGFITSMTQKLFKLCVL